MTDQTIEASAEAAPLEQWPAGPGAVVGRPARRADGLARARGEALYTGDLRFPGTLHTAVLRSPHARARVKRIDLSAAAAAPGVRAVLGPGDCSVLVERCDFEGAPVAAVCADSLAEARAALASIEVTWKVMRPTIDALDALDRGLVLNIRPYTRGDIGPGLADADAIVEATYRTQTVIHNPLEPAHSICRFVGDTLEVHTSTQVIWGVRAELAAGLGMDPDRIRVVSRHVGGGFGSKTTAGAHTFIAIELARRTGRPVSCSLTRREQHIAAGNRNATIQRLVAGARADGTLTALEGEFVNATGHSGFAALLEGPMQMLYACPNVRTLTEAARLNLPPMCAFRGPGFVEGTFSLECVLDELARKLDLDPLELRRRNHAGRDPVTGAPYTDNNLLECYRRAEPHWERRHEVRARSTSTVKRGVGLASQIWWGAAEDPTAHAWIRVGSDGHAALLLGGQDAGAGTDTVFAQIAAEELGIPFEHVTVALGDSARAAFGPETGGSTAVSSLGPAVREAAADARRQLLELAATRFDTSVETLSLAGGSLVFPDGERRPLGELVGLLGNGQILGAGTRSPNPVGMQALTFGVQIAEVAVDVETGEVTVERIVSIHDVGRVINPLGASSQLEGGIIQALGHTLTEERLVDPRSGGILTRTLDAYRMPTIADTPRIVCELVDVPDANLTNLGSKGLGEPSIIPVAAAVANAVRDATGADVRSLPISRPAMLAALARARNPSRTEVAA